MRQRVLLKVPGPYLSLELSYLHTVSLSEAETV